MKKVNDELDDLARLASSPDEQAKEWPRLLEIARHAQAEVARRTRQLALIFELTHAGSEAHEVAPLVDKGAPPHS